MYRNGYAPVSGLVFSLSSNADGDNGLLQIPIQNFGETRIVPGRSGTDCVGEEAGLGKDVPSVVLVILTQTV